MRRPLACFFDPGTNIALPIYSKPCGRRIQGPETNLPSTPLGVAEGLDLLTLGPFHLLSFRCILSQMCLSFLLFLASCMPATNAHSCVGQSERFIFLFYMQRNMKTYMPTSTAVSERYRVRCVLFLSLWIFFFRRGNRPSKESQRERKDVRGGRKRLTLDMLLEFVDLSPCL